MRTKGMGQTNAARNPEKRTLRTIFWLTAFCSGKMRLLSFSNRFYHEPFLEFNNPGPTIQ